MTDPLSPTAKKAQVSNPVAAAFSERAEEKNTLQGVMQSLFATLRQPATAMAVAAPWVVLALSHTYNDVYSRLFTGGALFTVGTALVASCRGSRQRCRVDESIGRIYIGLGVFAMLAVAKGAPLSMDEAFARESEASKGTGILANLHAMLVSQQPDDIRTVDRLISKLTACPEGKQLWDDVQKAGQVTVVLGSKQQVPSQGLWEGNTRIIGIDRALEHEDNKLTRLLLEACNAHHNALIQAVVPEANAGKLSKMGFLKKIVEAEFASVRLHHRVAEACVKSQGWHPNTDLFKGKYMLNPRTAWAEYLSDNEHRSHRELYYQQWTALFKEAFCVRNPNRLDCLPHGQDVVAR